ncbi:MAG: HAD-IA family hydrolase [Rhodospirillales bacterium]
MTKPRYRAVIFDLLTALLDSWSLWNAIAGSTAAGLRWRTKYLALTYGSEDYEDYEFLVSEAARQANVPIEAALKLIDRWADLTPWPEAARVLQKLAPHVPLGVATNCSRTLGHDAAEAVADLAGISFATVITAEEAGFYKPHPLPYEMALNTLGTLPEETLFVAGSPHDVPGAAGVGMPVYWHNRLKLANANPQAQPAYEYESLEPLLELFSGR